MLDKQYSRIIRWVNRAQTMSAGGKYSDAILDVECARAELDDARQELLLCHQTGAERKKLHAPVLILTSAFCAVLFLVSPLEISQNAPGETADEGILKVERSSISASESQSIETASVVPFQTQPAAENKDGPQLAVAENAVEESEKKIAPSSRNINSEYRLSERDVYRLVEVGRNALQKNKGTLVIEFN